MNDEAKKYARKQKNTIIENLENLFPDIPLYEDEVPQEETSKYDKGAPYRLFVLKMGAINRQENMKFLTQDFSIDFYSENRDDVDETILDVITVLKLVPNVTFTESMKMRARHTDTNRFVDIFTLEFKRGMKIEC